MDVVVVGSANLDVMLSVPSIPRPGETLLSLARAVGTGGKGANQAVAAARSGARTGFLCALGDDDAGRALRSALTLDGVQLHARPATAATGTAYVLVDRHGENAIVVDSGANATLLELTADELARIGGAQAVLCQLEVPLVTVEAALRHARQAGALAVLNAAPAAPLPATLLGVLDALVVNETEAQAVSGEDDIDAAVAALAKRVPEVVVTLGAAGALVAHGGAHARVPGVPARRVVDTTGAGDAFCGAYVAARARGMQAVPAAELACAAASVSVERAGAASAPTLAEAQARLAEL